ncbi:hypothetical protein [Comamonas sp. JC664]|uniref:hypothetical protein n=1 Tax=Comamonas sp. JC664 TaxID=2801917 RepID=UPI00361C1267
MLLHAHDSTSPDPGTALPHIAQPRLSSQPGRPSPPACGPQDHWIEQLGRRRNDDFAWLKYIP